MSQAPPALMTPLAMGMESMRFPSGPLSVPPFFAPGTLNWTTASFLQLPSGEGSSVLKRVVFIFAANSSAPSFSLASARLEYGAISALAPAPYAATGGWTAGFVRAVSRSRAVEAVGSGGGGAGTRPGDAPWLAGSFCDDERAGAEQNASCSEGAGCISFVA